MPIDRRKGKRKSGRIKEYLNMRVFLIIIAILIVIIFMCLGINKYMREQDRQLLVKQKEELEQQTQQIFSQIEDNISQTNKNISETDEIIKMSVIGDILCGDSMIKDAYNEKLGTYDFSHMFRKVSGYINKADIIMGTMETNFTRGEYNDENAPKEFAKAVRNTGINLVTISHNHSLDYGLQGLKDTKLCLEELGYSVVGDKLDNKENAVLIRTIKNTRIAFLTYTDSINKQSSKTKEALEAVSIYSEEQVKSDIAYAKENDAEYIVVMIHWGDAISDKVNQEQKEMADFLIENGVHMILGAHPSVVQPMEVRKNSEGKNVFIAYSIGTYISTLADDNSKIELVLNVELRKSGKDGEVYLNKVDYTPIYVLENGREAENRYELIDMKSTATNYASGNTTDISRKIYDKLVKGLKKLEEMLAK